MNRPYNSKGKLWCFLAEGELWKLQVEDQLGLQVSVHFTEDCRTRVVPIDHILVNIVLKKQPWFSLSSGSVVSSHCQRLLDLFILSGWKTSACNQGMKNDSLLLYSWIFVFSSHSPAFNTPTCWSAQCVRGSLAVFTHAAHLKQVLENQQD